MLRSLNDPSADMIITNAISIILVSSGGDKIQVKREFAEMAQEILKYPLPLIRHPQESLIPGCSTKYAPICTDFVNTRQALKELP